MSPEPPDRLPPAQIVRRLEALYTPCTLCEQRCGAARAHGERGACGLDHEVHVYNRLLHYGEEAPLVPSYAIFTEGCSMSCSFCSEGAHLLPPFGGQATAPEVLALKVALALTGEAASAHNINFVGGEPSIALPFIARFAQALDGLMERRPPLLLNTNGYLTPEALALASHLCELFVVDLKFGDDRCAQAIGGVQGYTAILRRNLSLLHDADRSVGGVPVMAGVLWVRHLLMPGHISCCTAPTLEWLAVNAPRAHVNLMPAFHPFGLADNAPWGRLSASEIEEGRRLLAASGLANAWFDGRRFSA